MLETVSSNKVKPFYLLLLGSSSTDGEDKNFLTPENVMTKKRSLSGQYPSYDVASHLGSITPILENETYRNKEIFAEEMIEHDIYVKMSPKRRRTVKFKIQHIRKARPRLVIPENYYTDI